MRLMRGQPGAAGKRRGSAHRAAVAEDGALRLALEDGEERLPWLQAEEDDEDEAPGVETGRVLAFALGAVFVLAVLGGGAWWLWQSRLAAPPADGSIIEAPEGPYRVRPADPGGTEVAGTGSTSFRVGEGREDVGRIAPLPEPEPVESGASGAGASQAATPGEAGGGVGVQIGAYPTREAAQAGWQQLHSRLEPLHGRSHRILPGISDSAPVFRLQVVSPDAASAQALCRDLQAVGGDCQVKR